MVERVIIHPHCLNRKFYPELICHLRFSRASSEGEKSILGRQCTISGFVSRAGVGVGRGDNDRQFLFCNGRPVDLTKFNRVLNEVNRGTNRIDYISKKLHHAYERLQIHFQFMSPGRSSFISLYGVNKMKSPSIWCSMYFMHRFESS